MTLDVRGSLKNTKLSANPLVVVEELFSNAVDAFLIRKRRDPVVARLEVTFNVEFMPSDLLGSDVDLVLTCQDNGVGLGDEQAKAFLTKDTSYKDDLGIAGIGQCKGAGRIQYFHHFKKLELASVYASGENLYRRALTFEDPQKQIEPESFHVSRVKNGEIGTRIVLSGLKPSVRPKVFAGLDIETEFSAKSLKNHILVFFMHRLIGLKQHLGEFVVSFTSVSRMHGPLTKPVELSLTPKDLPNLTAEKETKVFERDRATGNPTAASHALTVSHYALDAEQYDLPSNIIALCAKSSPVKIVTDHFLKPKAVENNPINDAYHVVLVEGDLLDQKVNEQRDGFDLPQSFQRPELFLNERVALDDILDAISETVEAMIRPPEWSRDDVAADVKETFGVSQQMLADTDTRIVFGDTPHAVAKRVLTKYQERAIEETAKLFDLKEEIYKAEPDSDTFRQKVNELAWKHTAMLNSIDMANLSQLIVRRATIVEILALACGRNLRIQNDTTKRRKDEELIHNIFFPRRKDSKQVTDHDVWLLSEVTCPFSSGHA